MLAGGNNFGNARFIVCPQKGGAVGNDKILTDIAVKARKIGNGYRNVLVKLYIAPVIG